ncbi:carboxymuconolactone decarboxylase family protein [Acetobacter estunensis]|uniref:carboxymuconolactone decarboxylase family protein n=1 Tax=Acetobacter estunensis TaxID=104097 RepID=UPI001C2DC0D8|nr:carboxymuconolactone decarboxylase family protein [Acetobacter estunensis]MBV1838192.1 carboxymuconolactone decarboxylase family protein [Acetobacter estunensis]
MSIDALKDRIPDFAKDLRLNLSSLASDITLDEQKLAGTFVASAIACRNAELTRDILDEFGGKLSPEALNAAKAAAAIMGMNNIYYRFTHMVGGDYTQMPAKLRMSVIARPGVDKVDFELWSLAVSAINGCEMCVQSHERAVREGGLSSEQVQTAVRIAATLHGVAAALEAAPAN